MNAQSKDWRDDPRLTAYAFGELAGSDAAEVETLLAENDEARQMVDELRAFGGELEAELTASAEGGLTDEQRATIEAKLGVAEPKPAGKLLGFWSNTWRVAAGIAIVGLGSILTWEVMRDGATGSAFEVFPRAFLGEDPAVARVESPQEGRWTQSSQSGSRPSTGFSQLGYTKNEQGSRSLGSPDMEALRSLGYLDEDGLADGPARPMPGVARNLEALGYLDEPVIMDAEIFEEPIARSAGRVEGKALGELQERLRELGYTEGDELAGLGYLDDTDFFDDGREGDLRRREQPSSTEAYDRIVDNALTLVRDEALSTFSIDVDTASYSNVRRFLNGGQLPPPDAVRIEELINYFDYEYLHPAGNEPFGVEATVADCPWAPGRQLVRIGLQGRTFTSPVPKAKNLVFLLDVSGSMNSSDKLPLLKQGFRMLTQGLGPDDRVAIAVYAGASGLVLPSTPGRERGTILSALERLSAGGSTNGGAGIELAYQIATENFIEGGINRVILATDGDFNVGTTSQGELIRLIETKRETGVFLSVLGFGQGNLKDSQMEQIADHGNGAYHYIDSEREARKVLVRELDATLETIAKDVKIQVEFNPAYVQAYRLVGYANRLLAKQDFNDDTKDAGEIGAGHSVTAFYEIVPVGAALANGAGVDELKYQPAAAAEASPEVANGELLTVKLRYKQPDEDESTKIEVPLSVSDRAFADTTEDFRFAAAVALFGMVLRDSQYKGDADFGTVLAIAESGAGPDPWGDRAEFLQLVRRAGGLARGR